MSWVAVSSAGTNTSGLGTTSAVTDGAVGDTTTGVTGSGSGSAGITVIYDLGASTTISKVELVSSAVNGGGGFNFEYSDSGASGSWTSPSGSGSGLGGAYTYTLSPNLTHRYWCISASAGGSGTVSISITDFRLYDGSGNVISPSSTPSAPTSLTATGNASSIALSWTAPSGTGLTYNIYRGTSAGAESTTPLTTGLTSTSYSDSAVSSGQQYYYQVAAVNSSGTGTKSSEAHDLLHSPDFSLTSSAPAYSLIQGANTSETITINDLYGFNGSVALSLAGLPGAAGYTFTPGTTSTTSSLQITCPVGVATGTYALTVTGIGSSGTHTAAITLTITAGTAGAGALTEWVNVANAGINTSGVAQTSALTDGSPGDASTGVSSTASGSGGITAICDLGSAQSVGEIEGKSSSTTNSAGGLTFLYSDTGTSSSFTSVGGGGTGSQFTWTSGLPLTHRYWAVSGSTSYSGAPPSQTVSISMTDFRLFGTSGNQLGLGTSSPVLSGSLVANSPTLSWTTPSGTGLTYTLYRATSSGSETELATNLTSTTYTDSVAGGPTYYYKVSASSVNGESLKSNEVSLTPIVPLVTISSGPSANPSPVINKTATITVGANDTYSNPGFVYTWSATGPASVSFSPNGTTSSASPVATFSKAGTYSITVTIADNLGATATKSSSIIVNQTPTALTMLPTSINVKAAKTQQFTASETDQFGNPIVSPNLVWSALNGTITSSGFYTAPLAINPDTVTVADSTVNTVKATATVTVQVPDPPLSLAITINTATPISGTSASLTGSATGTGPLTYTWTSFPTNGVIYSPQVGTSSTGSSNTNATLTTAGETVAYLQVTDAYGQSNSVTKELPIVQTGTILVVTPNPANILINSTQQFIASLEDQFGASMPNGGSTTWSVPAGSSAGGISSSGLYTAPGIVGSYTVQAQVGSLTGIATVNVTGVTSAPTGVTAQAWNAYDDVAWSALSGAAAYNVYRSTSASGPFVQINPSPVTSTTYNDPYGTVLASSNTYYYTVTGVNSAGESQQSAPSNGVIPEIMQLTSQGVANGFTLTTFATGFAMTPPAQYGVGPLGIAFYNGSPIVGDFLGIVTGFQSDGDNQLVSSGTTLYTTIFGSAAGVVMENGSIYVATQAQEELLKLNSPTSNAGVTQVGANQSFASGPTALVVNPITGHLYTDGGGSGNVIYEIDPVAGTWTLFASNITGGDGMAISADGKTLYLAQDFLGGDVQGYDTTSHQKVYDYLSASSSAISLGTPDAVALGSGAYMNKLFVNCAEGNLYEIELDQAKSTFDTASLICTGGSRGDLVGVDPNGSLLITQCDRVLRLSAMSGGFGDTISLAPPSLTGGATSTATIYITSPAPASGLTFTLTSSNPAAQVQASVVVPAGATSVTFSVTTSNVITVTTSTIIATLNGNPISAVLTINPAPITLAISLSPTAVIGGASSTATVTLSNPAPIGGLSVALSSDNTNATVTPNIQFNAGQTALTTPVTTLSVVSIQTAHIKAIYGSSMPSAALTINPSVTGLVVTITSPVNNSVFGAPNTVPIIATALEPNISNHIVTFYQNGTLIGNSSIPQNGQANTYSVQFNIPANAPPTYTLTASAIDANGQIQFSAPVTLNISAAACMSGQVQSLVFSPTTFTGMCPSTGTLTLSSPALTGGEVITLINPNSNVVSIPQYVTVPAGQTTAIFAAEITPAASAINPVVTASYHGTTASCHLTVAAAAGPGLISPIDPVDSEPEALLTPAAAKLGFKLTTYAYNFPHFDLGYGDNPITGLPWPQNEGGPEDIANMPNNEVLVTGFANGSVDGAIGCQYVFPDDIDGKDASLYPPKGPFTEPKNGGPYGAVSLAVTDGYVYTHEATTATDDYVFTINQADPWLTNLNSSDSDMDISPQYPGQYAMVVDPVNPNWIFCGFRIVDVSQDKLHPQIENISDPHKIYTGGDGMAVSIDGKYLFGVTNVDETHFGADDWANDTEVGAWPGPADGMVVGSGGLSRYLLTNANYPDPITKAWNTKTNMLDLYHPDRPPIVLTTGGTRGDQFGIGSNGTLYITQSDRILRLIPPPNCGFGQAVATEIDTRDERPHTSGAALTEIYTPLTVASPNLSATSSETASFNLTAVSPVISQATMERSGVTATVSTGAADIQFGIVSTTNSSFVSYSKNDESLENQPSTSAYDVSWPLQNAICTDIKTQLTSSNSTGSYQMHMTDLLSSVCGSYSVTDQPQNTFPVQKNILTVLSTPVGGMPTIPAGRSLDLVIAGFEDPTPGAVWDVIYLGNIGNPLNLPTSPTVGIAGDNSGWHAEADFGPYRGVWVTVPMGTTPGNYEVRYENGGYDGSADFIVAATDNGKAAVMQPIVLSSSKIVGGDATPGDQINATMTLDDPAPVGGATVRLSSNSPSLVTPTSVTIPANSTSISFALTTSAVAAPITANLIAEYNGTRTASLNILDSFGTVPAAPILSGTAQDGADHLQWQLIPGATGYIVERSSTHGGPYTILGDVNATTSSFDDQNVTNLTTYYYTSQAYNIYGNSASSNEVSLTPSAGQVATPVISTSVSPDQYNTYHSYVPVTITDSTSGSVIYYRIAGINNAVDDSMFGAWQVYTGTFSLYTTSTVQAKAIEISLIDSGSTSQSFSIQVPPITYTFALKPGAIFGGQSVTATVSLSQPAPPPGVTVNITPENYPNPSNIPLNSGTFVIPQNSSTGSCILASSPVSSPVNLSVLAGISGGGSPESLNLTVNPAPAPPTVTITAPASGASVIQNSTVTVTANAAASPSLNPGIASVTFKATPNGPGSIINLGQINGQQASGLYTVHWVANLPGGYELTATATDTTGQATTSSPILVTVSALPQAPTPTISPRSTGAGVEPGTYTANVGSGVEVSIASGASDPTEQIFYTIDGNAPVIGNADTLQYTAPFPLGPPSTLVHVKAIGSDLAKGLVASGIDQVDYSFSPGSGSGGVAIGITNPGDSQGAQPSTVTGITHVMGYASQTGAIQVAYWELAYAPANDQNSQSAWTLIGSGIGGIGSSAAPGNLGTFDPTLLTNGQYVIELIAYDASGLEYTSQENVLVDGAQKVGYFTMSFNDMTVPIAGMPITVTRTYDSRRKSQLGDFGYGWTLSTNNVTLSQTDLLGQDWSTSFPGLLDEQITPTANHMISITLPDGTTTENFVPYCTPDGFGADTGTIGFQSLPGTHATLALSDNAVDFVQIDQGVTQLQQDGQVYAPTEYVMTTPDGYQYDVDQFGGLIAISDRIGNTTYFDNGDITTQTNKNGQRSVTITRGANGVISSITDPSNASVNYGYDGNGNLTSVTDRVGNTTSIEYDASHLLTKIHDPRGYTPATNNYDATGRLLSTTDADGNSINYSYDLVNNITHITDRLGHVTDLQYDSRGNVLTKTQHLATSAGDHQIVTSSVFADSNNPQMPTMVTDPLGRQTQMVYDTNGHMLSSSRSHWINGVDHPLVTSSNYDQAFGQLLSQTDPIVNANQAVTPYYTVSNQYDNYGNLLQTTDPLGHTNSYAYNLDGTVQTTTDALNHVSQYLYDADGDVTTVQDANGHNTAFTYDVMGRKTGQTTTRTNGDGTSSPITSQYQHDLNGNLTQLIAADGATVQTVYNTIQKVDHTVDPLGRITLYVYDDQGRLVSTKYPDGTITSQTYDANGNRATSMDKVGRITKYIYDSLDRLVESDNYGTGNSVLSSSKSTLDDDGEALSETDANGNATKFSYDDLGRKMLTTDALHIVIENTTYDSDGRSITSTDALGHTSSFSYDNSGQLLQTNYPNGTSTIIGYDSLGRKITEKDQNGFTTHFAYDSLGRLSSVQTPMGHIETYSYDELGEKLTQTDSNGHTSKFSYDNKGHLTDKWLPAGQHMYETYNADGTLNTITDYNGHTVTMHYDSDKRLIGKTDSTGTLLSISFNLDGTVNSNSKGNVTTSYLYDQLGRVASVSTTNSGTGGIITTVSYTYDPTGHKKSQTTISGTLTYDYDADERLIAVHFASAIDETSGTITALYTYDAVGNRHTLSRANGIVTSYTYDQLNRLLSLGNAKSGATVSSFTYILDLGGRRTSVTDQNGATTTYAYDNDGRLTGEFSGAVGNVVYQYDNVGNRLFKYVNNTLVQSLTYDLNDRIISSGYSYDVNGNVTSDGTNHYVYDWDNKMTASGPASGGQTVSYTYNADELRVQQISTAGTTNYTVDSGSGFGDVVEERDQAGNLSARYDNASGLLDKRRNNGTYFYLTDGLGSTRQLTDINGNIVSSDSYDAFGTLQNGSGGSETNTFLFDGQQLDTTGLYNLRARYMNPLLGLFSSQDPFGGNSTEPISLTRYLYAGDNPVMFDDPSGMSFLSGLGTSIHGIISTDFVSHESLPLTRFGDHTPISTILDVPTVPGATTLMPDCADLANPDRKYIFEIKPYNFAGWLLGEAALDKYISVLNACTPFGARPNLGPPNWDRGNAFDYTYFTPTGGNVITLGFPYAGWSVVVIPPIDGLIMYIRVRPGRSHASSLASAVEAAAEVACDAAAGADSTDIEAMADQNPLDQAVQSGEESAFGAADDEAISTGEETIGDETNLTIVNGGAAEEDTEELEDSADELDEAA